MHSWTLFVAALLALPSLLLALYPATAASASTKPQKHLSEWTFSPATFILVEETPGTSSPLKQRQVRSALFTPASPSPLRAPQLVGYAARALRDVMDVDLDTSDPASLQMLTKFVNGQYLAPHSKPLAHNYGGHQFGVWADQLGDGRAVILGEYTSESGQRWELQLKGSGKTPFSRDGDGRAVLRSSIREFLGLEALHHLGVPSTRGLALVASSLDRATRDPQENGKPLREPVAILLRASPSWLRFGSYELWSAALSNKNATLRARLDILKQLVDFTIEQHFPHFVQPADSARGDTGHSATGRDSKEDDMHLQQHEKLLSSKKSFEANYPFPRTGSLLKRLLQKTAHVGPSILASLHSLWSNPSSWMEARVGQITSWRNWIVQRALTLTHHPSTAQSTPMMHDYKRWFFSVVNATASLVAHWQLYGFAHGVCNTDNFSILGLTLDLGPFAFLDRYDLEHSPNHSDDTRMYAFGNQLEVAFANLKRLSDALADIVPAEDREYALGLFSSMFTEHYMALGRKKLGFDNEKPIDESIVDDFVRMMNAQKADVTMCFRLLSEIRDEHVLNKTLPLHAWALHDLARHEDFFGWLAAYYKRLHKNADPDPDVARARMNRVNPRYVLRNWMLEEAIREAEQDLEAPASSAETSKGRFAKVRLLLRLAQSPFDADPEAELLGYAMRPPEWAGLLQVGCSS